MRLLIGGSIQLVTELKVLAKATLPKDFHTPSKSKKAVSQFIHPLLMMCIAASARKNPFQLPQRYLDEVTTWVEATRKEASLPSGIGTGAAAGAGEPLSPTNVAEGASSTLNPPEVTLAWEELGNADSTEKLDNALYVLEASLERFSQDTSNVKNAIDCLKRSSITTPISVSIGSSPFYKLSFLMKAWSQLGEIKKISAINEQLTVFKGHKEGDKKLKQEICDFVQSDEFSLFHLAKLLGCCQASGTLDQSQITNAVKHIARGGDLKALAFALVNSLSFPLAPHLTQYSVGLTFAQYSKNARQAGKTPMSNEEYAIL